MLDELGGEDPAERLLAEVVEIAERVGLLDVEALVAAERGHVGVEVDATCLDAGLARAAPGTHRVRSQRRAPGPPRESRRRIRAAGRGSTPAARACGSRMRSSRRGADAGSGGGVSAAGCLGAGAAGLRSTRTSRSSCSAATVERRVAVALVSDSARASSSIRALASWRTVSIRWLSESASESASASMLELNAR